MVKPSQREPRDALSSGWSSQAEIVRLQRRYVVELEPMIQLHRWLDEKRTARAACRLMGDSRTGKTLSATRWLRQCLRCLPTETPAHARHRCAPNCAGCLLAISPRKW